MAKSYTDRVNQLRDNIASGGLSLGFKEMFSAIPAGIGHFFDTLLRLDGLILGDRENFLGGPFGLLMGLPFLILGAIIGKLADLVLHLPTYFGYYILDRFLSRYYERFHEMMRIEGTFPSLIFISYTALTQLPTREMEGLFGFIFGVIPETVHYGLQRLSASITAALHYAIANTCAVVRDFYGSSTNTSSNNNTEPAAPSKKSPRIQRPKTSTMPTASAEENIDCFEILGITREVYSAETAKKAYHKQSLTCHPDKVNTPEAAAQWRRLQDAYNLLKDPDSRKAKDYLARYDNNIRFFKPAAAQPATGQVNQPRSRFVRPGKD